MIKILAPVTAAELIAIAHKKLITRTYKQKGERKIKKKIMISIVMAVVLAISLASHSATAEERWKVFEMGESGQTVAFKMTVEEITADNAEKARLAAIDASNHQKSKARLLVIDMGESGENISFPMSVEEIQWAALRESREAAKRTAQKNITANKPNVPVEKCELCESGQIISFTKN